MGIFVDLSALDSVLALVSFVSGTSVLHPDRTKLHKSKVIAMNFFIRLTSHSSHNIQAKARQFSRRGIHM